MDACMHVCMTHGRSKHVSGPARGVAELLTPL